MTQSTLRYNIAFKHGHASWQGMVDYFIRVGAPEKICELYEELINKSQ